MAVEYIWSYGPMKVEMIDGLPDVVTGIHWVCRAKDLELSETIEGMDSGLMMAPTPDPENYVTINELTSEMVESWISTRVDKPAIEAKVYNYLMSQLQPPYWFVPVPDGLNPVVEELTPVAPEPPGSVILPTTGE